MENRKEVLDTITEMNNILAIDFIKGDHYNKQWMYGVKHLDEVELELNDGQFTLYFTVSIGDDESDYPDDIEIYHVLRMLDLEGDEVEIGAELETLIEEQI